MILVIMKIIPYHKIDEIKDMVRQEIITNFPFLDSHEINLISFDHYY